jgi:hypothetical protein
VLFAGLQKLLDGNEYCLSPHELQTLGSWPENDALMDLRKQHTAESTVLGSRAARFTEGGYVALFSEGMKLEGRNAFDSAVAQVCQKIYQDEFGHMLLGIVATDKEPISDEHWEILRGFSVAQIHKRIVMRNAQFSRPVPAARMQELLDGQGPPVKFDFDYAERLMNKGVA